MKQNKFTKRLISIIIIIISGIGIYTIACGPWYDPDSEYVSLFDKALSDAPNTRPFYYSYFSLYDDNSFESDNKTNIAEWKSYTSGIAKESDINQVVYKVSVNQLITVKNALVQNKIPLLDDSLKSNSFLQFLINKKDVSCLNYLIYAKSCEPYVYVSYDDMWDYQPLKTTTADSLINLGLLAYKQTTNQFLKLRYAFQSQRLAQYSSQIKKNRNIYDSLVVPLSVKSDVKYWCMSLYAAALFRSGEQTKAAYLYSKVFDLCPRYRLEAFKSFKFFKTEEKAVIDLCKNNHEKAVFYTIMAYYTELPDTMYINKIYQLEPKSTELEVLLCREISKIEYKLQSIYGSEAEIAGNVLYTADIINAAAILKQRIAQIADNGNTANPALWNMALAYIAYLQKDVKTADFYLSKINPNTLNIKLNNQYNVLKVLVEIIRTDRITATTEAAILPYIQKMRTAFDYKKEILQDEDLYDESHKNHQFADRAYATLMTEILSRAYASQGDNVKALVCMSVGESDASFYPYTFYNADFLNSTCFRIMDKTIRIDDLRAILQFMSNPRTTEFDNFICNHTGIQIPTLVELIGTKFIRQYDFGNAVSILMINPEDRKDDIGDYIDANPFGDTISETHSKTSADSVTYTKLSFARRMFELENLLISDPANAAKYYYQLANAYYNITYNGNSWALVQYSRSSGELYGLDKNKLVNDYYTAKKSLDYFLKAIINSNDKEFKARCTMLAAKAYQVQTLSFREYWSDKPLMQEEYFVNNPYFESLYKDYRKTGFYKQTIGQCTYLKDFVANYKKK